MTTTAPHRRLSPTARHALAAFPPFRARLARELAEEAALMRLASVCRPDALQAAVDEAKRRADVFETRWRQAPSQSSVSPLEAGLDSVQRDVAMGWWA